MRDDISFGENCKIFQNVTIGWRVRAPDTKGFIKVGTHVIFGAGSSVIADSLTIGDNVKIGAGAIVLKDVPSDTTVIGVWK